MIIRVCSLLTRFLNSRLFSQGQTCRPAISSMLKMLHNDVLLQRCVSDVLSELTRFHVETRRRLSCEDPWCCHTFLLYLSSPKYCKPQELSTLIQNTSSFWRLIIYSLIFCAWHSLLCLFLSNIQCYLMKSNVDFTVTRGKKKQCVSRVWIMKWHNTQNTTHPMAEYIHWGVAAEVMPMKKETIAYVFRVHSALEVSMIIHMYEFLTSS